MRERAEAQFGGPVDGAVVTVPAYFDDAQRQATKDAAKLAGLPLLRLLNEPTAAAVAYGLDHGVEGIYAVYDLGGGTFDISILKLTRGVFEVLATNGDTALGGDDFDHRVFCWIIEAAKLPPSSPEDARLLLMRSRDAKEMLTGHDAAPIVATLSTGQRIDLSLTRPRSPRSRATWSTRRSRRCAARCATRGSSPPTSTASCMVGGATRMREIRRAVGAFFGQPPLTNLDPDEVVALGAAMQANVLAGNRGKDDDWLLLDVIPLSLGARDDGRPRREDRAAQRDDPRGARAGVHDLRDGQTAMAIHVVQGERERVADCRSLARFELRGIPPMVAGAARIQRDLPGRRRRPAVGVGARADARASRRRSPSSRRTASATTRSRGCCASRSTTPRTT